MTVQKISISEKTYMREQTITFERVMEQIKKMGLEETVTFALINKARQIPPGSLSHFLLNINTYVANLTRESHGKN